MFDVLCNISFEKHLYEDGHNRWLKHIGRFTMSNRVTNSLISIYTCWFYSHNESSAHSHEFFKTYNNTSQSMHKAFPKSLTVKHHHIIACTSIVISPAKTSTGMLYLPEYTHASASLLILKSSTQCSAAVIFQYFQLKIWRN